MTILLNPPLTTRNGHVLRVLAICRISTVNQDERSLEDQEAYYRGWLTKYFDRPFDMEVIASRGSGECIDRVEYQRAIERVESGEFDLVISEDLGRICRRVYAHIFCETCEDHDTRLIAINDQVDTGRDDWRLNSYFAVMRHEAYNRDTALRIRRSLRNRFSAGGVVQCEVFGYIKPPDAKSDADLRKDPNAEPIYEEWFHRLENGASYAEVADWLNSRGIEPGPYCRSSKWDGPMVGRITNNPILKGLRVRNRKLSRRVNSSGRRKSVNAPREELLTRDCSHLQFIEPGRYDRVIEMLRKRNGRYRRRGEGGRDTRANVPKKRTRFPGQSVYCGVCGRLYVFGGHGQKDHLMCAGAREYRCWNGVTFDGSDACRRLSDAVFSQIESLPAFESEFLESIANEIASSDGRRVAEPRELECLRERNQRETDNMLAAIRQFGANRILLDDVGRLEREKLDLEHRLSELQRRPRSRIEIPSIDQVKQIAREEVSRLAAGTPEFGRLMSRVLPAIHVFPYRLCDGGHIVLRACATFTLLSFLSRDVAELHRLQERLTRHLCVDLFEPPQREEYRQRVVQSRLEGNKERLIATELGITTTAVQRAAALQRLMDTLGIDDPWVPVRQPPDDNGKLCRHLHKRYAFEPLIGYPRAWPA